MMRGRLGSAVNDFRRLRPPAPCPACRMPRRPARRLVERSLVARKSVPGQPFSRLNGLACVLLADVLGLKDWRERQPKKVAANLK